MLPAGTEVEGAASPYAPLGAPRISYASPPYSGGLGSEARRRSLGRQGRTRRLTILPLPLVTNDTIKLCQEGTWQEMKAGCNAFKPSIVPNPGWFASIFSEQTPEIGLSGGAGRPARELSKTDVPRDGARRLASRDLR